jgi:glycine/D-amino acid oxidase-like deaminating enzyme
MPSPSLDGNPQLAHPIPVKVLVRGAGFAGLACCWHLLEAGHQVSLYDPKGIGGGASGISPGLLHRYPGAKPRRADDTPTRELLHIAGPDSHTPKPVLRIPQTPEQEAAFRALATQYDDLSYENGLLIHSALTVHPLPYLNGLWHACLTRGATWGETPFDLEILAIGAAAADLVPIELLKGQLLRLQWPDIPPLPYNLIGRKYLVMGDGWCEVGATYERNFTSPEPDLETAKQLILPDIIKMVPELENAPILDCRAGIRASPPGHFPPIIRQLDERRWLYTGLGSKGLLYHATFAKQLIASLL